MGLPQLRKKLELLKVRMMSDISLMTLMVSCFDLNLPHNLTSVFLKCHSLGFEHNDSEIVIFGFCSLKVSCFRFLPY